MEEKSSITHSNQHRPVITSNTIHQSGIVSVEIVPLFPYL